MELTVQNVYGLLLRSKLLPFDEAKAMFARWNDESKEASGNLARFTAWMVANKFVTEYQATLLVRGQADNFFIGDYKILERIGKGRMAGVYMARHKLGQVVAIKVLPPSKARDPMMLGRFQREAKLALKLKHPNVVRGYQTGQSNDLHYLVMEYLEGETLEDALASRKKYRPTEAVRIIHQALMGLQHIHEQALVHRDLKPANLMLVPGPGGSVTVKILDIGLGRVMEDGLDGDPGLTGEGVLLGTPDYMAPEQARDARSIDIRADIYSLGCVLYHLLSGQPPFPDTNIISQMIRHASEPPRPITGLNPEVPDGLQQILNWMMAKAPDGRYPTPERAARALEVFLAADSPAASDPDLDPGMKPYLDWLEKQRRAATPSGHTIPTTAPPKPPSATIPVATVPIAPPKSPKPEPQAKRKKKAAPPPPPAPASFDVELVALPPPVPPEPAWLPGGLTRRDLACFFIGAGSAAVAYLLGWGVARLLRRPAPDPVDEDTDP